MTGQIILEAHELIIALGFFVGGFILGYISKTISIQMGWEKAERTVLAFLIVGAFLYNNVFLGNDNWILNILIGIVIAHMFEIDSVKKAFVGLIRK